MLQKRNYMIRTTRKPSTAGEILAAEFMKPFALTQKGLADLMGVPRKHINELCNDRRRITADTALMLSRVFSNTPDFWLNIQRRVDLWEAMHSPDRLERIARAKPLDLVPSH